MAKQDPSAQTPRESVISIIGPGMTVVGDCEAEGTVRVEGVVEGTVRTGKAVVVGRDGEVRGDIITQDAVIGGRVTGKVVAESRLELQASCVIEGEVRARRIKLEEGGQVNGKVSSGEQAGDEAARLNRKLAAARTAEAAPAASGGRDSGGGPADKSRPADADQGDRAAGAGAEKKEEGEVPATG